MSIFNTVEDYSDGRLRLSFKTEHRGIWQCEYNGETIREMPDEPPFHTLKSHEQKEIKQICPLIYYWTTGEIPKV